MTRAIATLSLLITLFLPALQPSVGAQPQDEEEIREVYSGTLVGLGGTVGGRTATFTLNLTGRSTRDQALRYAELLRTKGQDALRKQLDGRDVGRFSLTGRAGQTVNFAYEQQTPEGRRVIAVWERWLQPFELRYGSRSQDYPFTYLEISIDRNGKGTGTLIGAAKLYFEKDDPSQLTVENFATYPIRVVNVRLER